MQHFDARKWDANTNGTKVETTEFNKEKNRITKEELNKQEKDW